MTQVALLSGIYCDSVADYRTSYPRNLVPVPKSQGVSQGYIRSADGLEFLVNGPGVDRGGINWNGLHYRAMGSKLVSVAKSGTISILGDIGTGGDVTFDYSFDRLGVASGGALYYWDGTSLVQVADPDIGNVIDFQWVDGYFMTTDGEFLVVTELNDPTVVNPLKYGSSEADPDPVLALLKLRNEIHALNRYTIEVFSNVGGTNFPFQRIDGAIVQKGVAGTHACCLYAGSIAFLGSGRNEAPSIYVSSNGAIQKIATREIDQILADYTSEQLALVVLEERVENSHDHLLIHLPDQCLVYDAAASAAVNEPVWFTLTSSVFGNETYRAKHMVYVYDRWHFGDPNSFGIGVFNDSIDTHFGEATGWDFGSQVLYNEGYGAIVHEMELVGLPGRVSIGSTPIVWTSYSTDGETWSQERAAKLGRQGDRDRRIWWAHQGFMRSTRIQRFRGANTGRIAFSRLEMRIEPLNV